MPLLSTIGSTGAQSYGNRGLQLGGSGFFNFSRLVVTSPTTQFAYGFGDFTLEMWCYPTSFGQTNTLWRQASAGQTVILQTSPGAGTLIWGQAGSSAFGGSPILNQWNHIAVVRSSGVVRIYLNGFSSAAYSLSGFIGNPNITPVIGSQGPNSNFSNFFGFITNFRVTRQALYTANFEPSRRPFTLTSQNALSSNVALLLDMRSDGTLTTDRSGNSASITNISVAYSSFIPYNQPYTPFVPVPVVSATVTPSTTTPSEGDTITITVAGNNTTNGTYYWTIEEDSGTGELTSSDFSGGSLSGTFTITSNSGNFSVTLLKDLLTENVESFRVFVRQTSTTGPIIGSTNEIIITDSSRTPAFASATGVVDEGGGALFTVQNVGPDGTYFWTVLNGTTTNADFTGISGSFGVSGSTGGIDNGSGSFSVGIAADRTTEGSQTFQVQVRSGSTSGPVILTSQTVTITDTSLTPAFVGLPPSNNVEEGVAATFTVNNLGPAGTYFWTVLNGTTANADFSVVSGSFTTSTLNGNGQFSITAVADRVTEGTQTFQIQVREGSTSGTVLVTSPTISIIDTSLTPSLVVNTTQIREFSGEASSIPTSARFTASNLGPAGTYFWTLSGLLSGDVLDGLQGAFSTITENGSADIEVRASAVDVVQESTKPFTLSVRQGSVAGTIIITSPTVSLLDSTIVVNLISGAGFTETLVTEGVPMSIRFTTGPGTPAGTYYWEIVNLNTTNADFAAVNGTFSTSGFGNVVTLSNALVANAGDGAESGESFQIRVRFLNALGTVYGLGGNFTITGNAT